MHQAAELVRSGHVWAKRNFIEEREEIRCAALDDVRTGQEQVGEGGEAGFVDQGVISLALG